MRGTVFAFIAIALFSSYAIFGKILLERVSPFAILILNQVLAGLILILLLDLFRKLKEIKQTSRKDMKLMYIISFFTAFGGPLLFLMGLRLTSATNAILIGKSEALITSLLAIYLLKERISIHQIGGAIMMVVGIALIATENFSLGLTFGAGDILILASAGSYAIGTVLFKRHMSHVPPEVIATLRNLFGASMLLILSFFFVDYASVLDAISPVFILSLLGLVIITTVLGQYFWYRALETTTATKVSLAGLSSPLFAIAYAMIFLGERISEAQFVGGLTLILGLVLLEFHFKLHRPEHHHKHHLSLKHWPNI